MRFELTTLRICNPLHLTTLPLLHNEFVVGMNTIILVCASIFNATCVVPQHLLHIITIVTTKLGGLSWDRTNTLTIMSCQHYLYAISPTTGAACRNRTHIRRVEAYCIIHYTNAAKTWYGWWDLNPQNSDFKSDMYTNSITSAILWWKIRESNPMTHFRESTV